MKRKIKELRPTQETLGYVQVEYNRELLTLISTGKSDKYKSIKKYLKSKTIPVILGPENKLYMVDCHHFLRSFWEYFNQDYSLKVYVKIINDFSEYDKFYFWEMMKNNNYVYGQNPENLPEKIGELKDDSLRSLLGLVYKITALEQPDTYFFKHKLADSLTQLGFKTPEKIELVSVYQTAGYLLKNAQKIQQYNNLQILSSEFKSLVKQFE